VRFYVLRLHEAGMVKSSPQKLIEQGTDWRFFNELKRELSVQPTPYSVRSSLAAACSCA
jgi:hypothetical protein